MPVLEVCGRSDTLKTNVLLASCISFVLSFAQSSMSEFSTPPSSSPPLTPPVPPLLAENVGHAYFVDLDQSVIPHQVAYLLDAHISAYLSARSHLAPHLPPAAELRRFVESRVHFLKPESYAGLTASLTVLKPLLSAPLADAGGGLSPPHNMLAIDTLNFHHYPNLYVRARPKTTICGRSEWGCRGKAPCP
jgi:hypothetical protein